MTDGAGRHTRFAGLAAAMAVASVSVAAPSPARAQSFTVAPIETQLDCRTYFVWWGWWMIVECRNNFLAIRSRIESALSESMGGSVSANDRGSYEVRGHIAELGVEQTGFSAADSVQNVRRAVGRMDISVIDRRSGRIVVARTVTAQAEIGSYAATQSGGDSNGMSGRAAYDPIQRKLALAAARAVAFHFRPLQVTGVENGDIRLNHGGSIMPMGALVLVQGSGRPGRYRIIASGAGSALAEADGDVATVSAGQAAEYVEETDPQNQGRRNRRTRLPEF